MSNYAKEVDTYLAEIKKGDLSKFKLLYDLISNHLGVVVRFYLIDKSYWEDVLEEVFEKIFKYIDSYVEGSDGYNWICKIAENIAFNYNTKFNPEVSLEDVEYKLKISSSELFSDENIDLFRGIQTLNEKDRDIIFNYFYLGKTLEEIGKDYHVSKTAIKKRLDKCLKILKKFIETGEHK